MPPSMQFGDDYYKWLGYCRLLAQLLEDLYDFEMTPSGMKFAPSVIVYRQILLAVNCLFYSGCDTTITF